MEEKADVSDFRLKKVNLNFTTNTERFDRVSSNGIVHNILLDNMINKNISSTPIQKALPKTHSDILLHPDAETTFRKITSKRNVYLIPELQDSETDEIISLFNTAVINGASSYKDLEYISNRYILEVANSKDLTENQQDNVISAVFTMASSAEYWKVFDQNTK